MTAPPTILNETLSCARKEFLHGIFTTALEGGIGYWSEASEYHWSVNGNGEHEDLDGFHAIIEPPYDVLAGEQLGWGIWADKETGDTPEDLKPLTIDLAVIHRGVKLFIAHTYGYIDDKGQPVPIDQAQPAPEKSYRWQFIAADATNGHDGDYDADIADTIVQWGLFGEVVYG